MNNFFIVKKKLTLKDLCGLDNDTIIGGIQPLDKATPQDISFFHTPLYVQDLKQTQALACLIQESHARLLPPSTIPIICQHPYQTLAQWLSVLYEPAYPPDPHPISPRAIIGQHVRLGHGCIIGPGVHIGDHTVIEPNAVIHYAHIGSHVRIGAGAVIGSEGFGFDLAAHVSIPQVGMVRIGDHVSIGANTTVDRGSLQDTEIGDYTRIDNLVQIAHNVRIGHHVVIAAQTGIAGSTQIGHNVSIGGQVGIVGHVRIGDHVKIAAQSGVAYSLPDHAIVAGSPAIPLDEIKRQLFALKKLGRKND